MLNGLRLPLQMHLPPLPTCSVILEADTRVQLSQSLLLSDLWPMVDGRWRMADKARGAENRKRESLFPSSPASKIAVFICGSSPFQLEAPLGSGNYSVLLRLRWRSGGVFLTHNPSVLHFPSHTFVNNALVESSSIPLSEHHLLCARTLVINGTRSSPKKQPLKMGF